MFKKLLLYLAILSGSVLFFLLFVVVFLNGTDVTCSRQADETYTCGIQTLFLGKFPTFHRDVSQIVGAQTVDDGCSDGCAYRTEFILKNGSSTPLSEVYTDRGPVNEQTSKISNLISSGQPTFEYAKDPPWWVAFLIGGLFLMEFFILTGTMGIGAIKDFFANRDKPDFA